MAKSVRDIMTLIREEGIKMVDFKMVDINGQYRHVTIPAENFSEDTMKSGIGFDASNYGYAVVEKSDMVFIPDPDTAVVDPFCSIPTLSMTGNAMIIDSPENRPLPQYPRNIIRAAVKFMQDMGVADTMKILPEFEFYLFDDVTWNVGGNYIMPQWMRRSPTGIVIRRGRAWSSKSRRTITLPSPSTPPMSAARRCACS